MTGKSNFKECQYWDANIVIAIIKGEPAAAICSQILVAADRGDVEIITSTLTIAEVTGGVASAFDEGIHRQIDAFFQQQYIHLVAVDRTIAKRAQQLRIERHRSGSRGLAGNDAIHLATALDSNVDVMFTMDDDDLLHLSENYATKAGHLLPIEPPRWTFQSDFLASTEEGSESKDGSNK